MGWEPGPMHIEPMTERLARAYHEMTPVPNERPLSGKRLKILYEKISKYGHGLYVWQHAKHKRTGLISRMDGQHTTYLALQHPDLFFSGNAPVCVAGWIYETSRDLSLLYAQINSSESSRTAGDVNFSMAASTGLKSVTRKQVINMCVTSLSLDMWGLHYFDHTKEDRALLMDKNKDFVLFVDGLRDNCDMEQWRVIGRAPVAWAILSTWRKDRKAADKFWKIVAQGYGADPKCAERMLHKYLSKVKIFSGTSITPDPNREREPVQVVYKRCIVGWNAWRDGKSTKLIVKESSDPVPK